MGSGGIDPIIIFASALDGGEWSSSLLGRFTSGYPWVRPRATLNTLASAVQPVAHRIIDWALPASHKFLDYIISADIFKIGYCCIKADGLYILLTLCLYDSVGYNYRISSGSQDGIVIIGSMTVWRRCSLGSHEVYWGRKNVWLQWM
jgi:hypothetical protein